MVALSRSPSRGVQDFSEFDYTLSILLRSRDGLNPRGELWQTNIMYGDNKSFTISTDIGAQHPTLNQSQVSRVNHNCQFLLPH